MHLDLVDAEKVSHFNLCVMLHLKFDYIGYKDGEPDVSEKTLSFQFLNNFFAHKFVQVLNENIKSSQPTIGNYSSPAGGSPWDQNKIDELTEELKQSIETAVKFTGIDYPIDIDSIEFKSKSEEKRQFLNYLHRTFTHMYHSNFTSWGGEAKGDASSLDSVKRLSILESINAGVHKIEEFYQYNNPRHLGFRYEELMFNFKGKPIIDFEKDDFSYSATNGQDGHLWLPVDCMRGKNIQTAYFDNDDPTQYDIVNENVWNGSFAVGHRDNFLSEIMTNWCASKEVEPKFGVPIANLVGDIKDMNMIVNGYIKTSMKGRKNPFKFKEMYIEDWYIKYSKEEIKKSKNTSKKLSI